LDYCEEPVKKNHVQFLSFLTSQASQAPVSRKEKKKRQIFGKRFWAGD
jgi:hypothetical protein